MFTDQQNWVTEILSFMDEKKMVRQTQEWMANAVKMANMSVEANNTSLEMVHRQMAKTIDSALDHGELVQGHMREAMSSWMQNLDKARTASTEMMNEGLKSFESQIGAMFSTAAAEPAPKGKKQA